MRCQHGYGSWHHFAQRSGYCCGQAYGPGPGYEFCSRDVPGPRYESAPRYQANREQRAEELREYLDQLEDEVKAVREVLERERSTGQVRS